MCVRCACVRAHARACARARPRACVRVRACACNRATVSALVRSPRREVRARPPRRWTSAPAPTVACCSQPASKEQQRESSVSVLGSRSTRHQHPSSRRVRAPALAGSRRTRTSRHEPEAKRACNVSPTRESADRM
eukprot:6174073-Pleurochrysis_carterae.AAC.2